MAAGKPADETRESDFWLSKSNLHQVGGDYFVPEWMVVNALEEFRAHSKGSWKCLHRFPAFRAVWPSDKKDAWVKAHVGQLPTEEELLQAVREKEQKQADWEKSYNEKRDAEAKELKEKKEAALKELARNIKKWEKEGRECQKGVSIQFDVWGSIGHKADWITKTLHGVDLYL